MKFVAISDTHNHSLYQILDGTSGDVLLHAGDALGHGGEDEWKKFCRELAKVRKKFKRVLYTPGNHDIYVSRHMSNARKDLRALEVDLVMHEAVSIAGIKIFMSPYTPRFGSWAFMKERGLEMMLLWDQIPHDTDILVTHGPPMEILDFAPYSGIRVGCEELKAWVTSHPPKFHIFGHIHHEGGKVLDLGTTKFINASICNERYEDFNNPMVFDYDMA